MERALWREDGSAVLNCCWLSPEQSFLGSSPAGLITIFYSLRFKTLSTWRTRSTNLYPPVRGWPSHSPRHWVSFSPPPTTSRTTEEVSKTPPHWLLTRTATSRSQSYFTTGGLKSISSSWCQDRWGSQPELTSPAFNILARTVQKTPFATVTPLLRSCQLEWPRDRYWDIA
jgi:hypothetical protein